MSSDNSSTIHDKKFYVFNTDTHFVLYVLKTAVLIALINFIPTFLKNTFIDEAKNETAVTNLDILLATTLHPLIETLLMVPVLYLISKMTNDYLKIVIISALFWSVIHSLFVYYWWITVFIPYLFFTMTLLVWSKKSILLAILMTAAIHGLYNGLQTIVH